MNHTIMEHVRIMLNVFWLDNRFWEKVVNIKRLPTTLLDGNIPEEVPCGNLVLYSHSHIWDLMHLAMLLKKKGPC